MASITFEGVEKRFGEDSVALRRLDLEVLDGEFLVLVGPSGCGKTTALRLVAGLEELTAGTIRVGDEPVDRLQPWERDIAMVFQSYALYPHMTVAQNVAYPLKVARVERAERERRARDVAAMLGIEELLERKPGQLSGGQRQRVAMGRAMVRRPGAFLMDEPLSNLDAQLRVEMRMELLRLHREVRTTTLYVTHDQVEAMTMGDRIALMRDGTLQQLGTPVELYQRPANLFAATFIGSPSMNLFEGTIERGRDGLRMRSCELVVALPQDALPEGPVVAGIRPDRLTAAANGAPSTLTARVELVEVLGSETQLAVRAPLEPLAERPGAAVRRGGDGDGEPRLVATVSPDIVPRPGERISLTVEPAHLHFFSPETGERL